jgi:phosphoserine phosphatase
MWTKLRPGARALLAAAAQRYELWIHTAATARYAAAVAEVLGAGYFGGRIIAQADAAGGGGGGGDGAQVRVPRCCV